MITNVTRAFQNAAINGEGVTHFLPEPRRVTFGVTGNGSVSAGAVTIECCPGTPMISTPLPPSSGSGAGSGTTWTSLITITVPANATAEYIANVVGSVRARISTPISGGTVTVLGVHPEDQKGWSRCQS